MHLLIHQHIVVGLWSLGILGNTSGNVTSALQLKSLVTAVLAALETGNLKAYDRESVFQVTNLNISAK